MPEVNEQTVDVHTQVSGSLAGSDISGRKVEKRKKNKCHISYGSFIYVWYHMHPIQILEK